MAIALMLTVGQKMVGQTTNIGEVSILPNTIMSTVETLDNKETADFVNDGELFLYSHFNNDGLVTYTSGKKGYTRFQGTVSQKIEGSVPSEFYDVIFNNPSPQPAFHLYGEMRVAGNADFFKGIVKDDDFGGLMVFENDATHTNTKNESHVDGEVSKKGTSEFQYPIGDKELYRYARISAPSEKASDFTAKYFFEDSNPLYPHTKKAGVIDLIDNQEYWTIEKTGGKTDIMLTLSWDENTTTPANIVIAPQTGIHIVRWDAVQKLWVDEGEVAVDIAQKTVTTMLNVDGYGVFTLARVNEKLVSPKGNIVIHNAISPNGDGKNDYFFIDGISKYPKNTVEIYNRWGVKVFETNNYDSSGNVFRGYSDGRATIERKDALPTGTYFYTLKYVYEGEGILPTTVGKAGYLYINSEN